MSMRVHVCDKRRDCPCFSPPTGRARTLSSPHRGRQERTRRGNRRLWSAEIVTNSLPPYTGEQPLFSGRAVAARGPPRHRRPPAPGRQEPDVFSAPTQHEPFKHHGGPLRHPAASMPCWGGNLGLILPPTSAAPPSRGMPVGRRVTTGPRAHLLLSNSACGPRDLLAPFQLLPPQPTRPAVPLRLDRPHLSPVRPLLLGNVPGVFIAAW